MCVIMMVDKTRPTTEMIEKAWAANKDGAGIAWWEGSGKDREIIWQKGVMDLEDIKALCAKVPTPYVVHFRVASVGGVKETLTHPFVISATSSLALEGRTKGSVLFHNGHWGNWDVKAMEAAISSNNRIPTGDWSDTRAIAWMSYIYGPGFFELLPAQKGIIMNTEKMEVFLGSNGWDHINNVWCSNDIFWTRKNYSGSHGHQTTVYGRMCEKGKCINKAEAGKKICKECATVESASDSEAEPAAVVTQTVLVPSTVDIVTGGGNLRRPLAGVLTLHEAEALYKSAQISKSLIKKFRREYPNLGKPGGKGTRAKEKLTEYSNTVTQRLLHGSAD